LPLTFVDIIDILIVSFVIYKLIALIRGTRAVALIKGLAVLFLASALSRALRLRAFAFLLDRGTTALLVALPVVFAPEVRRTLERIGRGELFARSSAAKTKEMVSKEVALASGWLARRRIGGLIVLARESGLQEYVETGFPLDALVSHQLLRTIFTPASPLHDGAVIIREGRVAAAGCVLPLAETREVQGELGTRHRAGLGLSEQTDALVVIISEERGAISLAVEGAMERGLDEEELEGRLQELLDWGKAL
jgi:diadenylate cyclase